jgi:hypothetical protein
MKTFAQLLPELRVSYQHYHVENARKQLGKSLIVEIPGYWQLC